MPDTAADPPGKPASKWADLAPRVISAVVLIALTGLALFSGREIWAAFVTLMLFLGFRELARFAEVTIPTVRRWIVAGTAAAIGAGLLFWSLRHVGTEIWAVPLALAVPLVVGVIGLKEARWVWVAYGLLLELGAMFLAWAPTVWGPWVVVALVLVIAASDMAGYFAGRSLGGPKFWPRVSPKKTWSGTVAGWVAAGLVGAAVFALKPDWVVAGLPFGLGVSVALAVGLAFAGQMGDVVESALKRRVGLKDSSKLIPGHGGVLDRIDALVAAAALAMVASLLGLMIG